MNIVLLTAHSVAEYDDVRMFTDLGHDVFSIGAYIDPAHPGDDLRPSIPGAAAHPELAELCVDQMHAKENLPEPVIEWADVIICHHYLDRWVIDQWPRLRRKRVIWRTCGQSDPRLELAMKPLRNDGLQIVRYSPVEERYFTEAGAWAGQDALIRFGKYPGDYGGWSGWDETVANVSQDMVSRGEWCGLTWYLRATEGLRASPAGSGSELLPGGLGKLSNEGMLAYLRRARVYAYGGTHPASYTLALIEALMVGIPVISIGARSWMGPDALFEAPALTGAAYDDPYEAGRELGHLLRDPQRARYISGKQQASAELFDIATVGPQWQAFLRGGT